MSDPPETGVVQIDQALAGLPALGEAPLAEHAERLASAHDIVRDVLADQGPLEPKPDDQDDPAGR
ncbi:MAG TPA: hypothetical protein VEQ66_00520 [Propionibacteriaceae bacterium]|nr:hypothetical protein [Propionibacteriaceae bacterium]